MTAHETNAFQALPEDLLQAVPTLTEREARKILSWVHRTGRLPDKTPSGIRRDPYLEVFGRFHVEDLTVVERAPSQLDPFVKLGFSCPDGAFVEAVRIPLEKPGRFVACVSSQAGCGLGCAFCATGKLGLARNLNAWEIVQQVRHIRAELPSPGRIHGVVFQGMGDPLANLSAVIRSVRVMTNPSLLAIDARAITVCSAGILKSLPMLFSELPQVRVAISLGSAIPEVRAQLMPIEKANPLTKVLDAVADQARATTIAPMLAYTLLHEVNDNEENLDALARLLDDFTRRAGFPPRLSLIQYNSYPSSTFCASTSDRTDAFRTKLGAMGIPVVRRYSGGSDVGAACGQLGMNRTRER